MPKWFSRRRGPALTDAELASTFRRALLAVLEGDYDRAEGLLAEAVQADSEDVEPYRALARLYRLRGEIGRAIRIHQNLLLRRNLADEHRNAVLAELAADFREGGFLQRSIASYQEVLSHDPKHVEALRELRSLLIQVEDYPQALAIGKRLAKREKRKDPGGEALLLTRMAELAHGAGDHDQARKTAKRALRQDPKNADAQLLLGQLEAERGRKKAALAAWRAVARNGGPRAAEVLPKLEATFASLGKARDYEAFLRETLEERPADAAVRRALAGTLRSRGEAEAAELELRRALDTQPDELEARVALGQLLLAEGRTADAAKEHRELLGWLESRIPLLAPPRALGDGELE